jgi:dTDP-glucose pyrophosphorylase
VSALIITMAGESRRFREAGYDQPKYRLQVHGRTLFSWSIESLKNFITAGWRPIFVGRSSDETLEPFIRNELASFDSPDFVLVQIDQPTDGQSSTAMLAQPHVDNDEPCAIYNIDTYVDPAVLLPHDFAGDGWIPCFPGEGDGWSFIATDADGTVTEVREKIRVSSHCTVGLYGFNRFDLFSNAYELGASRHGEAELKERYIAPLYNVLISNGSTVKKHCLPRDAVVPLGTPAEVDAFANGTVGQ